MKKKFKLGNTVITKGVDDLITHDFEFRGFVLRCMTKYINCDWGDSCEEDKESNDYAVEHGERILAVYKHETHPTIWIITEWDRSVTTILFPSEY